ncbi:hypothetical protein HPP92_023062 [Vanilla planifolia]|uniref:Uncharacterized protein n=1 Tax=Vanilla planifolia TaxID=51239 RepID=A0A835PUF7_VANPL|nr:hypothetical protein HPP92_023062 [Vanilla planifolia]
MGDENELRPMVEDITSSLKGANPIEVLGLNMEEEMEAVFDEAVRRAWKMLGNDAFINCYLFEGKIEDPLLTTEDEYKKTLAAMEIGKHNIRVKDSIARGLHLGDKFPLSVGKEGGEADGHSYAPFRDGSIQKETLLPLWCISLGMSHAT